MTAGIEDMMEELFSELEKENYLQPCDTEEMADRLAYYLSEINALHPFRDKIRTQIKDLCA